MDHDLRALYEILDCQIVKGKPEDEFRGYLSTLERKYENQKQFIRSLECNSHVGLEEDKLSIALIPEDLPSSADKIYKAVKTTGNGDCIYNAVSLALVGDESCAILLRLLVALELAINVSFYAQHPKFTYFPSGGRHPNTVFSLCLTRRINDVFHDSAQNRELAVFSEARTASQPKEWSGYFQVSALSAVLARPVFSSYPTAHHGQGILCMGLSTLEWQHSRQKQFSCYGQGKEVIIDLVRGLSQITLFPCSPLQEMVKVKTRSRR